MRIAFFASTVVNFHAQSLDERPLGGTETGIIRLSNALATLGHEVSVLVPMEGEGQSSGNPRYLPHRIVENHPPVDVFISVRDWIPTMYRISTKLRMLWTGDSYDQFSNFGMGDKRVHSGIDTLLTVSDWQADRLCEESGFPRTKAWKLGNGIHSEYFKGEETKQRKRLIYSSTPHRGLKYIPNLFSKIRGKHPESEIHIFSSYKVYDQDRERDYAEVFAALEKLSGVVLHGSIKQSELAREFMKSSILFYPCDFEETSCITAMEAMASGCVPVTTHLGALPETIRDAGILIEGKPGTADYDEHYLKAVDRLLTDDAEIEKYRHRGLEGAKELSWNRVAQRFVDFLKSHATA